MKIQVSAPGKALVCGEYAVLADAPAIVMALDHRAVVTIKSCDHTASTLTTPGLTEGSWDFNLTSAGDIVWQEQPALPVRRLLESAILCIGHFSDQYDICIDTRAFFAKDGKTKLGLGSSAAAATALTTALMQIVNAESDGASAYQVHQHMQQSRGSGVDIAASLHGGLLAYRRQGYQAQALAWPEGLRYRILWSGSSADTAKRLAGLSMSVFSSPEGQALCMRAESLRHAWPQASAQTVLLMLKDYIQALRAFSDAAMLDIFAAGHAELMQDASEYEVVYKPCGAGGGDIGMAFAENEEQLLAFCQQANTQGYTVLDSRMDTHGLAMDSQT